MSNFPRLWGHFKKDPFQFHSLHRPAKLECTEKAKNKDYQCQLHSRATWIPVVCSAEDQEGPRATWIPVACPAEDQEDLATEESNGQQSHHRPYAAFTRFCHIVFMFRDAGHLSPSLLHPTPLSQS